MIDQYNTCKAKFEDFDPMAFNMMEFDLQAYLTSGAEFDFMSLATGNAYNPLAWFADWTAEYLYGLADAYYIRGPDTAPDDAWKAVFGPVYAAYYRQFIYTAEPTVAEIKYVYEQHDPMAYATEMMGKFTSLFLGFEPECPGVQAALQSKLARLGLLLPQWLMFLVLVLVRAIALIIYSIVYVFYLIWDFLFDIQMAIRNWFITAIYLPIYNLLLPVINFFVTIHQWIMWLVLLLPSLFMWLGWIIIDLLWQLQWWIFSIFIIVHDWFWSVYWAIYEFIWSILWPIIELLLFIPNLILEFWVWLIQLIFVPLDGICVSFFGWLEGVADAILSALPPPEWEPAWFELALAMPIIAGDLL